MSDFQCGLEIPEVKGLESEKLTVGRVFYYRCKGDWPAGLQVDNLKMQAVSEQGTPYDLRLLAFEFRDPKTAELMLVSYRPGPHKFTEINLTDGTSTVSLPPIQIETHSVIDPNNPPAEPFGPQGPLVLPVPWAYWVILVSVLGIGLLTGLLFWKRKRDRRYVLEEIKRRSTHASPLVQFHRELRILTKKAGLSDIDHNLKIKPEDYLKDLRMLCEVFWGQKFRVALLNQDSDKLKPEFKSQAPKTYIRYKKELLFWNQKWESLFKGSNQAKFDDFKDFTLSTRELIEKMAEEEL